MKLRFDYKSWLDEDRAMTGGYHFPMLDTFGPHRVSIYTLPETAEDLAWLDETIHSPKTIFSYVDGGKVVVVRGGFTLEDMGLSVLTTDATEGKTVKRLKTLARPFRLATTLPNGMRIKLIEGGAELDGAFVVDRKIYTQAVNGMEIPNWLPAQQAMIRRAMDSQPIHNFRGVGRFVDAETGNELHGFAKGNVIITDLPDGIDAILTRDNFKSEVINSGGDRAWACFEPQGPKEAWEDQQTLVNQAFLLSVPEARERMTEHTTEYFAKLTGGEIMTDVEDLVRAEFNTDYAYDSETFGRLLRWSAHKWALHGLSYLLSPWLTERLGISYLKSFAIEDRRKVRIPIPGAVRAQVITVSLAKLAGVHIDVPPGEITWVDSLGAAVVSDAHWSEQIVPTHGGCDLDDFFVLRRDGDKAIITRSPNARGEYTVFDRVNHWWPESEEARPLTRSTRPTPIIDALGAGETSYIPLPSETSPSEQGEIRPYNVDDTMEAIHEAMGVEGGYGQYEIAVRSLYSLTFAQHMTEAIASEDAVDAFTQGGTHDDQQFILEQVGEVLAKIRATGKPLDALLHSRLPKEWRELIPVDRDGPLVQLKRVQQTSEKQFTSGMRIFTKNLEIPSFLIRLGDNPLLPQAVRVLRQTRFAMFQADQANESVVEAVNNKLIPLIEGIDNELHRHQFTMAFWYACRTVPTSGGKLSDQPVFGTAVMDKLLDALVYFGIAKTPGVDDQGRLYRHNDVQITHDGWTLTCKVCKNSFETTKVAGVAAFHNHDGVCKSCREDG